MGKKKATNRILKQIAPQWNILYVYCIMCICDLENTLGLTVKRWGHKIASPQLNTLMLHNFCVMTHFWALHGATALYS